MISEVWSFLTAPIQDDCTAVALVRDQEDRLVRFGCINGIAVEPEETNRYKLVIENVEIP